MAAGRLTVGGSGMMTEIAVTPAGVATDPELDTSGRPATDPLGVGRPVGSTGSGSTRNRRPVNAETERLYAADWRAFEDWCRLRSLLPLPADATTVAGFLTEGATTLSAGALSRRAAAIAAKHRQSGFASP